MKKSVLYCGVACAILTLGMQQLAAAPPPGGGPGGGPGAGVGGPGGGPGRPGRPPGGPGGGPGGPSPGGAVAAGVVGAIIGGAITHAVIAPPPPAPAYTAPAPLPPGTRATAVQQQLRSLGYYRSAVDGKIGPITRGAIRRYQADYGLPVTGRIDPPLLQSLGIR